MKRNDYLAMISVNRGNVTATKYCSSIEDAVEWAKENSSYDKYEVFVFKGGIDMPVAHYGFQSHWTTE